MGRKRSRIRRSTFLSLSFFCPCAVSPSSPPLSRFEFHPKPPTFNHPLPSHQSNAHFKNISPLPITSSSQIFRFEPRNDQVALSGVLQPCGVSKSTTSKRKLLNPTLPWMRHCISAKKCHDEQLWKRVFANSPSLSLSKAKQFHPGCPSIPLRRHFRPPSQWRSWTHVSLPHQTSRPERVHATPSLPQVMCLFPHT